MSERHESGLLAKRGARGWRPANQVQNTKVEINGGGLGSGDGGGSCQVWAK